MKRTVTREELDTPLLPYEEAKQQIVFAFDPLPAIEVALTDALGLACAEDVVADIDVPGFASSAMDGYAVRSADLASASAAAPVELPLIDDLPAGTAAHITVEPGTAAKIMTGAPIPPGADTIVPWEDTEPGDGRVRVLVAQPAGKHVRPAGEDLGRGKAVAEAGTALRPVHIGSLAMLGRTTVRVHPRPRIAVLSTGEELAEPGEPLAEGQVYDSNNALLHALCAAAGGEVVRSGRVGDDPGVVGGWITEAAPHCDLVVTSGGASVGEHDWMREVLSREGTLMMWRVALKPGKPIAFGMVAGAPVLALPGNPGSVYACTHAFVQPSIRRMGGRDPWPGAMEVPLAEDVKGSPARTLLCRVQIVDGKAVPLPAQSSVVLSNLIPAYGYAIVPPGGLPAGSAVRVEAID